MACGACAKRAAARNQTFEVKFGDGTTKVYATEREAKAAVARKGGTFRRVG